MNKNMKQSVKSLLPGMVVKTSAGMVGEVVRVRAERALTSVVLNTGAGLTEWQTASLTDVEVVS